MKNPESALELWKQIVWNQYQKATGAAPSLPEFAAAAELAEKARFMRRDGLESAASLLPLLPAEPMEHRLCSLFGD